MKALGNLKCHGVALLRASMEHGTHHQVYMHASLFSFYYTNDSLDQLIQMYTDFTPILRNHTLYKAVATTQIATSK